MVFFNPSALRYYRRMKIPPNNPEFAEFTFAMRHIMGVSKLAMTRRKEAVKRKGKQAKALPVSPDSGASSSVSTSQV
jgi:hypothetical protein